MSLPNPGMSFSPFAILTAEEMNNLIENIEALSIGTGLNDEVITAAKLALTTHKIMLPVVKRSTAQDTPAYPNASDSYLVFSLIVPDDYVSGNITVKVMLNGPLSTSNLSIYRYVYRYRVGSATVTVDSAVFTVLAAPSVGGFVYSFTILAANFTLGDVFQLEVHRDGPGVLDTSSANADLSGAWFEYTGKV